MLLTLGIQLVAVVILRNNSRYSVKKKKFTHIVTDCKQCCGAGRSRGFSAGAAAGADLKFELEPIFFGWLQLLFLAREKQKD